MRRKSTELEKQVCEFLNELREIGSINMFGSIPYIVDQFEDQGVDTKKAQEIFKLWRTNFNLEGVYESFKIEE